MGYRGQDLDLRTPQTWRATSSDLSGAGKLNGPRGSRPGYGGDDEMPIWVDDTVLACSNHAFDVALAHRAGEVRVEHLIHAMTRIDDAAEALEASGVRVAALRREIATVIASEIPVDTGNGNAAPRSSATFEQVLRLASSRAYQGKDAPASIEDVLYVLRELRPQGGAADLIDRHTVRMRERPAYRPRAAAPYTPPEPPRERVRRPASRYFANEPLQHAAGDPIQHVTDHLQNSRLDALEQMVRAISSQIANQHDDASRFSGGLYDRLESLETLVLSQPQGDSGALNALLRRLDEIETTVRTAARHEAVDLSSLHARLDQIESRLGQGDLGAFGNRFDQIEQAVRAVPATDVSQLASRLDQIEWNVRQTPFIDFSPVNMRIDQIEQLVRNNQPYVNVDLTQIDQRVGDVERNLANQLAALEGRIDNRTDLGNIQNRLDIIEEALLGQDRSMQGDLDSRIAALSDTLSLQQTTLEDVRAGLTADVREVAANVVEQSSRIARTGEGISELVRIVEMERTDDTNALTQMSERLETYRKLLEGFAARSDAETKAQRELIVRHHHGIDAFAARSADQLKAHQVELKEVHDALMKLNANQHTLASSMDQWRTEGSGDLAIIASRIEGMEREAGKPMAMLAALNTNMDNLNRMTVERYHRRNRFWYWLFGTDDWIGASWPSQMEKIEAERRALKAASH